MNAEEYDALLSRLSRPERLLVKRAWAKTERKPLWIEGANMAAVVASMEAAGIVRRAGHEGAGVCLTTRGIALGTILSRAGWPNCEKARPAR